MASSSPVRRIASIIDAVAASKNGMTLVEIATTVGLAPSTSHRTVNILLDVGYLRISPETRTYHLGDRLKRVLLLEMGTGSLTELARPMIVELAEKFRETAFIVQNVNSEIQLVDYYFSTRGSRTLVHPGYEFPLHASAAGKAIFAFQPDDLIEQATSGGFKRFMPATLTTRRSLRKEFELVRRRGYAVNDSELDPGVYALAVPLILADGSVIGALAIVGIRERLLNNASETEIATSLMLSARVLSGMAHNAVYMSNQ